MGEGCAGCIVSSTGNVGVAGPEAVVALGLDGHSPGHALNGAGIRVRYLSLNDKRLPQARLQDLNLPPQSFQPVRRRMERRRQDKRGRCVACQVAMRARPTPHARGAIGPVSPPKRISARRCFLGTRPEARLNAGGGYPG